MGALLLSLPCLGTDNTILGLGERATGISILQLDADTGEAVSTTQLQMPPIPPKAMWSWTNNGK